MTKDPGFDVPLSAEEIQLLLGQEELIMSVAPMPPQKILVTGAGGSIGRSVSRELLLHGHEVVALDKSERGLFQLQQSCLEHGLDQAPVYLVGDLGDYPRVTQTLALMTCDVVIHAAAHKHVGLMECNEEECRRNNLEHSLNLFQQAARSGVKRFIFLSTDKAVEPVGVMGRSKNEAERHLTHLAASSDMTLCILRLPNVLGSDGSVVQIFRRQLLLGRSLTITAAHARRLFVSPAHATQLILAALGVGVSGTRVPRCAVALSVEELATRCHKLWGSGTGPKTTTVGLGAGERLEEKLIAADEKGVAEDGLMTVVAKAE